MTEQQLGLWVRMCTDCEFSQASSCTVTAYVVLSLLREAESRYITAARSRIQCRRHLDVTDLRPRATWSEACMLYLQRYSHAWPQRLALRTPPAPALQRTHNQQLMYHLTPA